MDKENTGEQPAKLYRKNQKYQGKTGKTEKGKRGRN